jgi:hypothetical protein
MTTPTVGRLLHYSIAAGDLADDLRVGQVRPALVVSAGENSCNVQVFLDGHNDVQGLSGDMVLWKTSLEVAEEPTPGKLHWPPRT